MLNPYAPPQSEIVARPERDVERPYAFAPLATREARLGAAIIDLLVLTAGMFGAVGLRRSLGFGTGAAAFSIPLGVLCAGALQLYCQVRWGQSLGKRILRIRVVMLDGSLPSLARIVLLRALLPFGVNLIPVVGKILSIVDTLCIFGLATRCLHDRLAKTNVVRDVR